MKETENLAQAYDPRGVETRWYRYWEENGFFQAEANSGRPPFTIVIPPPNITGSLHIGHALNNTLQDILVRYKRMDGYEALWMPGTDHAGIATQNVVERELAREGKNRLALSREEFVARVWKWREESGRTILQQLKRLGSSCDWRRERFTMDEGLSRAVREVFVRLYEEGLIYQGDYVINWCPRCLTALSDLEVETRETPGKLYYLKYPLKKGGTVTVATTRPETMLGDTAVAVNPADDRYKKLVGEKLILPLAEREIPVIAEGSVDREFGTGAVKITPAHDFNDFEIARRHQLPSVNVILPDARMSEEAGAAYRGLDRFAAREKVLADLRAQGLLEKEENYPIRLGHCYRCATVTEPRLSRQWFVRIQTLADAAIQAVREGKTRIVPETWENNYFSWMENIRDWCISRQLWWGHQIPAWYCGECGKITVAREDPQACAHCRGSKLRQDEDVLDTWFSSALWPFSTLGWPDRTPELKFFYPTSVLVTSFDILFFWVARMMMMGIKFMGDVPFRHVYIHALVRDESGQKMSKSRGNIIDPLLIIDEYGADAFRFTLAALAAQGRDIRISEQKIEGYRHFANKIWNAFRFSLPRLTAAPEFSPPGLVLVNRWIVSRLTHRVREVRETLDNYKFNDAASAIYQFFWHELCDWYLESIKQVFSEGSEAEINETRSTLMQILAESLKLLHPFMPFLTEELWQKLPGRKGSIMRAAYPRPESGLAFPEVEEKMELLMEVVRAARNLRSERKIAPTDWITVNLFPEAGKNREILAENLKLVSALSRAREVKLLNSAAELGGAPTVARDILVEIGVGGTSSRKEAERLQQELAKFREVIRPLEVKLENPDYQAKASPEAVAKTRSRYEELLIKIRKTEEGLKLLEGKA
jgi:valyl-tRNA synthetase